MHQISIYFLLHKCGVWWPQCGDNDVLVVDRPLMPPYYLTQPYYVWWCCGNKVPSGNLGLTLMWVKCCGTSADMWLSSDYIDVLDFLTTYRSALFIWVVVTLSYIVAQPYTFLGPIVGTNLKHIVHIFLTLSWGRFANIVAHYTDVKFQSYKIPPKGLESWPSDDKPSNLYWINDRDIGLWMTHSLQYIYLRLTHWMYIKEITRPS